MQRRSATDTQDAVLTLYTRYGKALTRQCERVLKNTEDAKDVVQTLFLSLLKRKKTDVDFSYLYRACTNESLCLIRNRTKRKMLLTRESTGVPLPLITLEDHIVGLQLLAALTDRLDKKASEILVYRYLDDMQLEEIASLMSYSRKTIAKYLKKIHKVALSLIEPSNRASEHQKGENQ